ncbi:MAG: hypothetical protein V2A56_13045 [bacterium]
MCKTMKIVRVATLVVGVALLLGMGCAKQNPVESTNNAPSIQSLTWTPQDVRPGINVTLTLNATDADGDTLDYQWQADSGTFIGLTTQSSAIWTAPSNVGLCNVIIAVTDGEATVIDTAAILVAIDLTVAITAPADSIFVVPGTSITFTGSVAGYSSITGAKPSIRWSSDVDSLLSTAAVSTQGVTTFSTTSLSDTMHRVSLTATVNDTIIASDTVVVNNHKPAAPTIYHVERGYTTNRVSWTTSYRTDRFESFSLLRRETPTGTESEIARITGIDTTLYVDGDVEIGQRYIYRVKLKTTLGAFAYSDTTSIVTGVFTIVDNSTIGDLTFGAAAEYLYATLYSTDRLLVLDVTGNNVDHTITVGDAPWGICANTTDDKIYVANSSDASITVLDAADPSNTSLQSTITLPTDPLYIDYFEQDSVLYVTNAENDYPLIVKENADGSATVDTLVDSRLRLIQTGSMVRVDTTNERLYISEVGNYAAGLWQYDLSGGGTAPVFLRTITHGALGYGLQDLALVPPTFDEILVAATSPYSVTIVNAATLAPSDSLQTGPYPNAVAVSPDGSTAYVSLSSSDVQTWDLATGTLQQTYHFAEPVDRGGVKISPDGAFMVVATYNSNTRDSRLCIVYLQ